MHRAETSFNAWVVVGNCLNLLLRGIPADAFPGASQRFRLQQLDTTLAGARPEQMLEHVHALPTEDRAFLVDACRQAFALAGADAESALGLNAAEAEGVFEALVS